MKINIWPFRCLPKLWWSLSVLVISPCCQWSSCEDSSRGRHSKGRGGWHREILRTCTGLLWRFWNAMLCIMIFLSSSSNWPDNLFILFWLIESVHLKICRGQASAHVRGILDICVAWVNNIHFFVSVLNNAILTSSNTAARNTIHLHPKYSALNWKH